MYVFQAGLFRRVWRYLFGSPECISTGTTNVSVGSSFERTAIDTLQLISDRLDVVEGKVTVCVSGLWLRSLFDISTHTIKRNGLVLMKMKMKMNLNRKRSERIITSYVDAGQQQQ